MFRLSTTLLLTAASLLVFVVVGATPAQAQKGNDPKTVSVKFGNETKLTVLVQGFSVVNGMQRRSQPILIQEGKSSFDNNVPVGKRYITVVDYNQSGRILLQDWFLVPPGRGLRVTIRMAPNNPARVVLVQDQ